MDMQKLTEYIRGYWANYYKDIAVARHKIVTECNTKRILADRSRLSYCADCENYTQCRAWEYV